MSNREDSFGFAELKVAGGKMQPGNADSNPKTLVFVRFCPEITENPDGFWHPSRPDCISPGVWNCQFRGYFRRFRTILSSNARLKSIPKTSAILKVYASTSTPAEVAKHVAHFLIYACYPKKDQPEMSRIEMCVNGGASGVLLGRQMLTAVGIGSSCSCKFDAPLAYGAYG